MPIVFLSTFLGAIVAGLCALLGDVSLLRGIAIYFVTSSLSALLFLALVALWPRG